MDATVGRKQNLNLKNIKMRLKKIKKFKLIEG
jgi:hypothetical protein